VKTINWQNLAGQVDILTAGYPCQPFSIAGPRKGIDDDRHIWPWIADAIRVLRPQLVVLENVRNHIVLGFDTVLGEIAEAGFDAEWDVVRAADIGAPHRRERLFVVAHPNSSRSQGPEPTERRDLPGGGAAAHPDGGSRCGGTGLRSTDTTGERRGRLADDDVSVDWQRFTDAIRRWERHLGRGAPAPLVPGTRQLNARLVEWMMGLDAGWVTDLLPNRRALAVLGNGVVPQQAALALRNLL
jgi:DNA (cytosine-5)-methyltransferase 1